MNQLQLKLREISKNDVLKGKNWKVVDSSPDIVKDWIVSEIDIITDSDVVFHSSVMVDAKQVFPTLISKYYEDGGEVGECLIFHENEWKELGIDRFEFVDESEGPYLSFISKLDIHEYQKGSFDNRKINKEKFDFYIKQLGNKDLARFQGKKTSLPKKVIKLENDDLITYLREITSQLEKLSDFSNVSKSNRLSTRVREIILLLKERKEVHERLLQIILSDNLFLAGWVAYNFADIFEKESLAVIKKIAKGDQIDAFEAQLWLRMRKGN